MDILRFLTAGNVDDGKSTLIGRLLYDSKNILIDQMEALKRSSKQKEEVDLALLTDGLRAEREQGITIDVAYKYFSTPRRKFIIADAPGHIQYTRNMVTGASNCDAVIILIDARNSITEQTKRHSLITSLLRVSHVIVAVNKMDLVEYSEEVYQNIVEEYKKTADSLGIKNIQFIPISALKGDNVVHLSPHMDWYKGEPLLSLLETLEVQDQPQQEHARFPVQWVLRPQTKEYPDYRGYAGKIESGIFKVNDKVKVYPAGTSATVSAIEIDQKKINEAFAPQSIVLHLEEDIDVSRGDLIIKEDDSIKIGQDISATICWMHETPLTQRKRYLLQHHSSVVPIIIKEIEHVLDVHTFEKQMHPSEVQLNEIAKVQLKSKTPLAYDCYEQVKENGCAILIDETSHLTVGAVFFS